MIRGRNPRRLTHDRRGSTIVEFALIIPVLLSVILGLCELGYQVYTQSVLIGAMQRAGRDSSIEGNQSATAGSTMDAKVLARVKTVAKVVDWSASRKSYAQFGNIAPEPFVDLNGNNKYDAATECFTDINGNNTWDVDPGIAGQGGASDVVVYTMKVTYARLFPVARLIGMSATVPITATTILKNQPYANQAVTAPKQVCP